MRGATPLGNLRSPQGATVVEQDLLTSPVRIYSPTVTSPGVNTTSSVLLASGREAFHKTFAGVNRTAAHAYGQGADTPPVHECCAWRLAIALGPPYSELVAVAVLREINGEDGALIDRRYGTKGAAAGVAPPLGQRLAAAFFDSLIAQQDRHVGNLRWDAPAAQLGLIDHGYAFATPGHPCNASLFVGHRHGIGHADLTSAEVVALEQLLGSPDLMGLDGILEPGRASALADRASRMLAAGNILAVGDF